MSRATIVIAAGLALAAALPAMPAHAAGVLRTFVSAAGSDSNNCANVMTPCRHLATAYAATAPDGEIFVLDPANYGSLTITGPVSIEGHGWASIAPPGAGTAAITINANTGDAINIIGVVLDGTAVANTTGIQFNSGGSLTVRDSVIRDFGIAGIRMQASPPFTFAITNTTFSKSFYGIEYFAISGSALVQGAIDHVDATGNTVGIHLNTIDGTGATIIAISNSIVSGSSSSGIQIGTGTSSSLSVSIDNTNVSANNEVGISAGGHPNVLLGRSVIMGNSTRGIDNQTNPNTFYTYQNNQINLNGNSNIVGGSALVVLPFQ
jgi:hypothetical protein